MQQERADKGAMGGLHGCIISTCCVSDFVKMNGKSRRGGACVGTTWVILQDSAYRCFKSSQKASWLFILGRARPAQTRPSRNTHTHTHTESHPMHRNVHALRPQAVRISKSWTTAEVTVTAGGAPVLPRQLHADADNSAHKVQLPLDGCDRWQWNSIFVFSQTYQRSTGP